MNQEELLHLIAAAKAGDSEAQERLVMETQNKVYYHCRKYLKNEADAQDAAQDVLISMLTGLENLREPAAFWGWLNRITANRCKHLLTRGPQEWQIPEDEEGNSMLDDLETLDTQAIPDQALDTLETQRLVMDIIDSLPTEQRMTVVFYYYDEMGVKDIAQTMEVSEGTVKSRLNYARKAIKQEVEKLEKKGTKLYSVSILPFLAYFLRAGAESQALPAAAAADLTASVLTAAGVLETAIGTAAGPTAAAAEGVTGTATGSAGTAGTAAGTAGTATAVLEAGADATAAAATAAAGTGTAVGATVAGTFSVKLIAAVLAGVIALGGIGAALYNTFRPAPDDKPISLATPTDLVPSSAEPTPEPTEEPAETPKPYAEAYISTVLDCAERLEDDARYSLVYVNDDATPELVVSYGYNAWGVYRVNTYTIGPDGSLVTSGEEMSSGYRSALTYLPRQNRVYNEILAFNGPYSYDIYKMDENGVLLICNSDYAAWVDEGNGNGHWSGDLKKLPETREYLCGDMTAEEILALLGYASEESLPVDGTDPDASDDENRIVLEGTFNIYTHNEVLTLQGIREPNPGSDLGETYQLIVLDEPQVLALSGIGEEIWSREVSIIAVYGNMEQYAGQHLTFSIDPGKTSWPTDSSLPVGEPRTRDIRVLG